MFLNNKLYFKLICDYINNKNKFVNIFYIMIN